ncbi:hypothetical protein E3N88_41723 [Mikania micrantha]|uniref:Reverse transcriptase Ty1/copia-type domain-containing protein n=1 Tax=Mikania micrantha TaxID=192012 RepID=A0A5N6LK00_9ASTR|nr:hypothetical protein E3N88_41723 [Mikania micrantha]
MSQLHEEHFDVLTSSGQKTGFSKPSLAITSATANRNSRRRRKPNPSPSAEIVAVAGNQICRRRQIRRRPRNPKTTLSFFRPDSRQFCFFGIRFCFQQVQSELYKDLSIKSKVQKEAVEFDTKTGKHEERIDEPEVETEHTETQQAETPANWVRRSTRSCHQTTGFADKWVFRVKDEPDGSKRYKARLVVKGFQQKKGIDYDEIFSPVVKMTTIRLVPSIVAAEKLHLEQLDVKTAFLHGDIKEEIYMSQPEGFHVTGKERLVCKLKRSLYGLKQAPRQWFKNSYIILILYVDDMLITGSYMNEIGKLKQLSVEFEMKGLGPAKQILVKPRSTPLGSRFKLSKDQSPKSESERAKWLRFLMHLQLQSHGTSKVGLCFKGSDIILRGYSDADLGGCKKTFKSTTGYVFTVGNTAVSWMSRLQKSVALSTTEAEYMAVAEASKELVSAVNLAKNPVYHAKTKHIGMKYHFVKDLISDGIFNLKNISGAKNPADMFIKPVTLDKLKLCKASAGLQEL